MAEILDSSLEFVTNALKQGFGNHFKKKMGSAVDAAKILGTETDAGKVVLGQGLISGYHAKYTIMSVSKGSDVVNLGFEDKECMEGSSEQIKTAKAMILNSPDKILVYEIDVGCMVNPFLGGLQEDYHLAGFTILSHDSVDNGSLGEPGKGKFLAPTKLLSNIGLEFKPKNLQSYDLLLVKGKGAVPYSAVKDKLQGQLIGMVSNDVVQITCGACQLKVDGKELKNTLYCVYELTPMGIKNDLPFFGCKLELKSNPYDCHNLKDVKSYMQGFSSGLL